MPQRQDNDPIWLQLAYKEIGVKEHPGDADNPRILEYHSKTTLQGTDDEIAWCSAFMCWLMEEAGLESTKSALARSWLKWGKKIPKPKRGCVVVLQRGNHHWQGHVGLYCGESGGYIYLLGGNQSDMVNIGRYPKHKVLGYMYPVEH